MSPKTNVPPQCPFQDLRYARAMCMTLWMAAAVFSLGCNPPADPAASQSSTSAQDDLTAREILSEVKTQYQNASSYRDEAILYLSYRNGGHAIQEPQPWSTNWSQAEGYSANLFNSQIRCNGTNLSCYVFDIESGNLDNQHLVIPAEAGLPLSAVFQDPIAKHFLAGYSEFPVDETRQNSDELIPPIIGLLTNQLAASWIADPTNAQRLDDQILDDQNCYLLALDGAMGTHELWINQDSGMIEQVRLPLTYLDGEVSRSPEITELQLVARFYKAQMNEKVSATEFEMPVRKNSKIVNRFVPIPERFPSELIGSPVPPFELATEAGSVVDQKTFSGKTTALLWLGGLENEDAIVEFASICDVLPVTKFMTGIVYSNRELEDSSGRSNALSHELKQFVKSNHVRVPFFFDRELAASVSLKMQSIPTVIVLGSTGEMQFAQSLDEKDWSTKVAAAVKRVYLGEDVAAEMRNEYKQFLENYHRQLADAGLNQSPNSAINVSTPIDRSPSAPTPITFQKTWNCTGFSRPGNLIVSPETQQLYVLDGWQTIATTSFDGAILNRKKLRLPDEASAINQLRIFRSNSGQSWFAGFSMLGPRVFVFDKNWDVVTNYPSESGHIGISDCLLAAATPSGKPEMIVAFADENGIHRIDIESGESQQISSLRTKAFAGGEQRKFISNDKVYDHATLKPIDSSLKYRRVVGTGNVAIALGTTSTNQWSVFGWNPTQQTWKAPIGPQYFENVIDSVSYCTSQDGTTYWAIASSDQTVRVFDSNGKLLSHILLEQNAKGLGLTERNGTFTLFLSFENRVERWDSTN